MILSGCSLTSRGVDVSYKYRERSSGPRNTASSCTLHFPAKTVFSCSRSSLVPLPNLKCQKSLVNIQPCSLSAASTPLLKGEQGSLLHKIPKFPWRCKFLLPTRASKDVPYSYRYPAMTKKPKWWWRSLACLPYLMPLHET